MSYEWTVTVDYATAEPLDEEARANISGQGLPVELQH